MRLPSVRGARGVRGSAVHRTWDWRLGKIEEETRMICFHTGSRNYYDQSGTLSNVHSLFIECFCKSKFGDDSEILFHIVLWPGKGGKLPENCSESWSITPSSENTDTAPCAPSITVSRAPLILNRASNQPSRSLKLYKITEKSAISAFSWLKVAMIALSLSHLRIC